MLNSGAEHFVKHDELDTNSTYTRISRTGEIKQYAHNVCGCFSPP